MIRPKAEETTGRDLRGSLERKRFALSGAAEKYGPAHDRERENESRNQGDRKQERQPKAETKATEWITQQEQESLPKALSPAGLRVAYVLKRQKEEGPHECHHIDTRDPKQEERGQGCSAGGKGLGEVDPHHAEVVGDFRPFDRRGIESQDPFGPFSEQVIEGRGHQATCDSKGQGAHDEQHHLGRDVENDRLPAFRGQAPAL